MDKNVCEGRWGAVYEAYIERPWLARRVGRLLWGIDLQPMFASMDAISEAPDGTTILDVPSGGGLALRALGPAQRVRYIAADISEAMLRRLEARAARAGLAHVETLQTDMRSLPLADGSAELVCTYSGLHMISDPEVALAEFARVLAPGGRLVGSSFVAEGSARQRRLFASGARRGQPMPPPVRAISEALHAAGLERVGVSGEGFVVFSARKPPAGP